MGNRYVRDEIIDRALNLIHSSALDAHDKSGGVINSNAYTIQWLQDCLDKYHIEYPFSGDVMDVPVTFTSGQRYLTITSTGDDLPTDYSIDVKDGIFYSRGNSLVRLQRKSLQEWLPFYTRSVNTPQQFPIVYCKFQGKFNLAPVFNTSLTGTLWYFSRPPVLNASSYPAFPDETCLIEYVRIKGLEWTKQYPPGTAEAYFRKALGRLKMAGLLDEPEFTVFPIEQSVMTDYGAGTGYAFLGQVGPVLS